MPKLPVIIGPTAGGKSALAIETARQLKQSRDMAAEIVTADAFQIYRGMDIGTAKPTLEERQGVPHHLIDIRDPGDRFTVADWLGEAEQAIQGIRARGNLPIVVGGTHLYIKSFLDGMFEGPAQDPKLRAELSALSPAQLRAELERADPQAAERLHPNDLRRTIRALEVFRLTGTPITQLQQQWDRDATRRTDCVLVGIEWPTPELNSRINARVRDMIARGLTLEVETLWKAGRLIGQARDALGYKQLIEAFEGRSTIDDAIERIKIETRHLAKAQRTWMRRLRTIPGSLWIDAANEPPATQAGRVLEACFAAK